MTLDKKKVLAAAIGCALCLTVIGCIAIGFFIGKRVYDRPMDTDIKRDTVTLWDTIPHYYPKPVEVEKVRTEYKWLTKVVNTTDTVTRYTVQHDSVLVEVPIESKHYHAAEYDAYISGYMPSLDSIKVYQKTEYITETITKTKRKPWGVGINVGYGYDFQSKTAAPFVGVGISYDIISF